MDEEPHPISYDRAVRAYLKMRDARKALKKKYDADDAVIEEQQDLVASFLLQATRDLGMTNFRTDHGIVIRKIDVVPTGSDWDTFYHWISDNDAFEALERRIKKTFIAQYMERNKGAIPPGVSVLRKYKVEVRRLSEKENLEDE